MTSWGPAELVFGEGNTLKPILFGGWPGAMGLVGANYARNGITGPSRLLESPIGYYSTVARAHDRSVVLDFENWRLAQPRRKLHACCGYTHSAIDLIARMRASGRLVGANRMRVHVPAYIIPAISKGGRAPATPNEARFNIEYCLAHASVDTDVILPEHSMNCGEHLKRADIAAALKRFEVVADPAYGHYRFSRVELLDESGRVLLEESNDAPRGSEWNPMSDEEVRGKFRRLAEPFMSGVQAESYIARVEQPRQVIAMRPTIARVEQLESQPNAEWLLRAFA